MQHQKKELNQTQELLDVLASGEPVVWIAVTASGWVSGFTAPADPDDVVGMLNDLDVAAEAMFELHYNQDAPKAAEPPTACKIIPFPVRPRA